MKAKGGRASAKSRKDKLGTSQPSNSVRTDPEQCSNQSTIHNPLILNPLIPNQPPTPLKGGKRKRRSRGEVIQGFPDSVKRVVNTLGLEWPPVGTTPDGEATSQTDTAIFCQRVFEILERGNDPDILIEAARNYFQEKKKKFSAPQFFFGVTGYGGKGEAPWVGYVKLILTKRETV